MRLAVASGQPFRSHRMSKVRRITGKGRDKSTKAGILYLFLLPMFASVVTSLFSNDYSGFLLKVGGFLLLSASVAAARKGLIEKQIYW